MRFFTILIIIIICTSKTVLAQPPCQGPGREPTTAQAVCGNLTFQERNVSNCTGPYLPNPTSGCAQVTTANSRWYKFHCYGSGTLGFTITPLNLGDDYDWEVMDITGHPVSDVYLLELRVSLNLSGFTGVTGCSPAGTADVNCEGNTPLFNRMINLVAGHDYLMMVNNWSQSQLGYDIDFSGTAILTNNSTPTITNVSIIGCDASKLKVTFSEDILCNTIANGTEFTIPGGPNIAGVVSDCSLGANGVTSLIVNLQSPLPAGNYQLNVNDGTDGNTFENVCRILMAPTSIPFIVPVIPPVAVNNITFTGCAPTVLNVTLSKPVWCSSITASGSEFSISPGNPVISSVQSACGTGPQYVSQLQIVLQNPLPAGNYQLVVNNGSDGNTLIDTCNISIPVGNSTPFVINTSTSAPVITSFVYDNCKRDKLVVIFDKPIACASLTATGSEFSIPNGPAITGILSNCGTSTYTTQVTLLLQNPMPPLQPRNIMISDGTDGNTLSDTCFSFITPLYTAGFTAPAAPPRPVFDSVQYDKCNPSFMKVFYSRPILCNSISPDGSQYRFIPPPGPVNPISATPDPATCSQGYTNWVLVQFSAPINTGGFYTLWHTGGSDGRAITDTCNSTLLGMGTNNIVLNVLGKPSATFISRLNWGCVMDTIVLSHPGGNGINSWIWNFSDGTTLTGQNVTRVFPISTPTVTVQLIVTNGFCSDTTSQFFALGNVINAAFTNSPDTFCINTPVNFTDASTGTIINYLWDFGDGIQFNGQNPPTHAYPVANIYNVQLFVTDPNGCIDTASKLLNVAASAAIDFTGLKPQYCTGNQVLLTRKISPNIISYVWDNGDGKTFTNEVDVNFSYPNEGVYTITLTGQDRYCGPSSVSKTVPVYAVPKVNLGPDTVLCQNDRMLIGVAPTANYTYMWNTGATTSQIYADVFTRDYTLTADNNGCRGYDDLHVKVLDACLIKVPNAFTPNNDGLNDVLKALNADLAKNFSFRVYNRLGQLMFTTKNPLEGWDGFYKGNLQETGAYVWMLSYIDPWTGNNIKEKGTSILVR